MPAVGVNGEGGGCMKSNMPLSCTAYTQPYKVLAKKKCIP